MLQVAATLLQKINLIGGSAPNWWWSRVILPAFLCLSVLVGLNEHFVNCIRDERTSPSADFLAFANVWCLVGQSSNVLLTPLDRLFDEDRPLKHYPLRGNGPALYKWQPYILLILAGLYIVNGCIFDRLIRAVGWPVTHILDVARDSSNTYMETRGVRAQMISAMLLEGSHLMKRRLFFVKCLTLTLTIVEHIVYVVSIGCFMFDSPEPFWGLHFIFDTGKYEEAFPNTVFCMVPRYRHVLTERHYVVCVLRYNFYYKLVFITWWILCVIGMFIGSLDLLNILKFVSPIHQRCFVKSLGADLTPNYCHWDVYILLQAICNTSGGILLAKDVLKNLENEAIEAETVPPPMTCHSLFYQRSISMNGSSAGTSANHSQFGSLSTISHKPESESSTGTVRYKSPVTGQYHVV